MKVPGHLAAACAFVSLGFNAFTVVAEETQIVVDRPGLFKMTRIEPRKKGFDFFGLRWRTDQELVVDAAVYKDWRAPGPWDQRVFRWNIDKDEISELPYTGGVVCLASNWIVLRRDVPNTSDPKSKKERIVLSAALFGQPAEAIESGSYNAYNEYSCEPLAQRPPGSSQEGYRIVALNPGHGRVYKDLRAANQKMWFLPDSGGKIQIGAGVADAFGEDIFNPGDMTPRYLPWLGEYLFGGFSGDHRIQQMWTYDRTLYFVSPDGRVRTIQEPALINNWKKTRLSSSYVVTAAGVLWWIAGPFRGKPTEFDGLYIERDGKLIRFLRHANLYQSGVAPDGCRALISVDDSGRNFPQGGKTELRLIDFCQEARP
jgi:hypothetical protein